MASKSTFSWDVDTWKSLDCYFNQNKILTQHQLESYNNLVDYLIPQIIERNNPVTIATDHDGKEFRKTLVIEFGQTYLSKPLIHENTDVIKPLYPNEARLRGLTYSAPMFIDVKYTLNIHGGQRPTTQTETFNKVPFLKLPVMLHSKYCHLSDHNESSLSELGECQYDQGGYFIVNGSEKVLISQERVAENQVFVFTPPKTSTSKFTHIAEIKTAIDQRFYPIKTNLVKLSKEPTARSRNQAAEKGYVSGRCLYVHMPMIKDDVPLFIMFRALGILQEKEIFEMILPDLDTVGSNYTNFLIPSVDEARVATADGGKINGITTQDAALRYLAERLNITFSQSFKDQHEDCQIKYVKDVISRELFPHIGQIGQQIGQTFRKKAFFLGHMTRKLIDCYFGVRPFDDRDHYGNKRVDLAGHLLNNLFRVHFIKLIRDLRGKLLPLMGDNLAKIPQTIRDLIRGCNIDSKIKYGLATGNWNTQKNVLSSSKKGIAQVLNRLSYAGALSHTRRIQSPLERSGSKIVPPRRLHGTHFGMCCPNETPEGQQIGIVKNLAMQTHVTIHTSDYPMRIILNKLGVVDLIDTIAKDVKFCTKIFVNGEWFGVIKEDVTHKLYQRLKILKRHGVIVPYISIAWFIDWKEIHIQTDGGRYARPVYIVEDDELLIEKLFNENQEFQKNFKEESLKWNQLLMGFNTDAKSAQLNNGGVIEYLDTNELETSMVAMTHYDIILNRAEMSPEKNSYYVKYTHCEIHPMMMMGVVASMIPFSDHNQSPRNCYQSSMAKQSIGYYVTNYNSRMDTLAHVLVYGHKPLVSTRTSKYVIMDKLPHGVTAMLLYACYTGYNQEDSIIVNGDAVDRGFFNTLFFRTYSSEAKKNRSVTTATERFTKPEPDKNPTRDAKVSGTYDAIDRDGVPIIGKKVQPGDVIIGKVIEMKETKEKDKEQESIYKDVSILIKQNEHGTVDKVIPDAEGKILPFNAEGNRIVKTRVCVLRKPEIGDKFASRYSQKGTTGILYKSYDMPFTCSGHVPDMIMNPHGIPSRMTVGKLLETLLGRVAVCTGKMQDATPFISYNFEDFKKTLKSFGMDELGNEIMYNGQTGQMFDVCFFYGPTYYQRLKHMVDDKIHSRESGPVQLLTRQPAEGRSRDGGLRLGEMERDVFIAHGIPKFLKERMMDSSDLFKVYVSKKEEAIIIGNPDTNVFKYNGQHIKDDEIMQIQLPYAMKLLLQELESMGIDIRLQVS
jgi:DNA-directed RNA polymerase II subunit RPB2